MLGMAVGQEHMMRAADPPPSRDAWQALEIQWAIVGMYAAAATHQLVDIDAARKASV
jgi:hypothetical protein